MTDPIVTMRKANENFQRGAEECKQGQLAEYISDFVCPFSGLPCTTIPRSVSQDTDIKSNSDYKKVN